MKFFIYVFLSFFSAGLIAGELSMQERSYLLERLPVMMEEQWGEPEVTACWRSGKSGDDRALRALYVMHKSISEITKNAQATADFLNAKNDIKDKKANISTLIAQRDPQKLKVIISVLPKAIEYCQSKMNGDEQKKLKGDSKK